MDLNKRANSFIELGQNLKNIDDSVLQDIIQQATNKNPWFTEDNIKLSLDGLSSYLNELNFHKWLSTYNFLESHPKTIGTVMAGNIPMVGIHDLICVLVSGHSLMAKLSSQDDILVPFITDQLCDINPEFKERVDFVDKLSGMEAVIATGSDNTSRYFDYYFSKYPNIIRKNRTSIAVLDGAESQKELQELAQDMFSYFGLGCRNVSKLFLPDGMDIRDIIGHFNDFEDIINHNKYHNNYFYNKSILLVNQVQHLDSGFALFQENENLSSPISTVYYEYYTDLEQLEKNLDLLQSKIQCTVSNIKSFENRVHFGKAQKPEIWDYADNIDTMDFLCKL